MKKIKRNHVEKYIDFREKLVYGRCVLGSIGLIVFLLSKILNQEYWVKTEKSVPFFLKK